MQKKTRIFLSSAFAAIMLLSFTGCGSDSEFDTKQEEMVVSEVKSDPPDAGEINEDTDLLGDSAIELVLKNSGADGYTICKLDGSEDYQLVLLYGDYKKECQFEFYTVSEENIENIGSLDGSNITAYIPDETKRFCICLNNSGTFSLGAVKYDGEGITIDWLENIMLEDKDDFPDLPGEEVVFLKANNPELIESLKDELPNSAAEESVELEE